MRRSVASSGVADVMQENKENPPSSPSAGNTRNAGMPAGLMTPRPLKPTLSSLRPSRPPFVKESPAQYAAASTPPVVRRKPFFGLTDTTNASPARLNLASISNSPASLKTLKPSGSFETSPLPKRPRKPEENLPSVDARRKENDARIPTAMRYKRGFTGLTELNVRREVTGQALRALYSAPKLPDSLDTIEYSASPSASFPRRPLSPILSESESSDNEGSLEPQKDEELANLEELVHTEFQKFVQRSFEKCQEIDKFSEDENSLERPGSPEKSTPSPDIWFSDSSINIKSSDDDDDALSQKSAEEDKCGISKK